MGENYFVINTADVIALSGKNVFLVQRKNKPFGLALPGGKLEPEESLQQAAIRELKEETGLSVTSCVQFKTYSDINRDPRGRYITTVFICEVVGDPEASSDAKEVIAYPLDTLKDVPKENFAFDHYEILQDYLDSITH